MARKLEDIIFEGLARILVEPPLEQADMSAAHPLIPALEQIATRGRWDVKDLIHTNTCAACRRSIRLLRQELGIKPWWQELGEQAKQAIELLLAPRQVVGAKTRDLRSVPAILLRGQKPDRGTIEVMTVRLTPDKKSVRLSVRLQELIRDFEETPIELTVVTEDGEPLESFLLPHLSAGRQEEFKLALPPPLQESWQDIEDRDE
ncbi:MAG: hypothetical protein L0Z53_18130, partial [Acidobacteriales bacterium]|nr:hypothetical protein [Terriglobales bacterium]